MSRRHGVAVSNQGKLSACWTSSRMNAADGGRPSFGDCVRRHQESSELAFAALRRLTAEVAQLADKVAGSPEVQARVKDPFSTWLKLQAVRGSRDDLGDLLGVRVLVSTMGECYAVLNSVLQRWPAVVVDDYVACPKANGYQSLHTVLRDDDGQLFEVQIRTHGMHRHSERGRAAHNGYKRRQLELMASCFPEGALPLGRVGSDDGTWTGGRRVVAVLCVVLVGIVGALDYWSGPSVGFAIFYLIPVGFATWRVGGSFGAAVALMSTMVWWLADRATALVLVSWPVALWNAVMRLGIFLVVNRTLDALRTNLQRLAVTARIDHVTDVANARGFFEAAQRELERCRRLELQLTVVCIDLDDFKRINDRLGHLAGNQLLRQWAVALKAELRSVDVVARLGGDEFAILLPETPKDAARQVVERLRRRLSCVAEGGAWPFTFSMGAVTFERAPTSVDEIVGEADTLMYEAKSAGKNTWRHELRRDQPRAALRVDDA